MTILRETSEVSLINTEHLNHLGKQVLRLKEKIAFVASNKNITELNKDNSVSRCLHSQSKKSSQLSR